MVIYSSPSSLLNMQSQKLFNASRLVPLNSKVENLGFHFQFILINKSHYDLRRDYAVNSHDIQVQQKQLQHCNISTEYKMQKIILSMFCKFSVNSVLHNYMLHSFWKCNFQFLLGQEKQLTELEASVLQNCVQISQLLKRKSHYLFTLWVDTPSGCKI